MRVNRIEILQLFKILDLVLSVLEDRVEVEGHDTYRASCLGYGSIRGSSLHFSKIHMSPFCSHIIDWQIVGRDLSRDLRTMDWVHVYLLNTR